MRAPSKISKCHSPSFRSHQTLPLTTNNERLKELKEPLLKLTMHHLISQTSSLICVRSIQKRTSATGKERYESKFCNNLLEVATIKLILAGQTGFLKARTILSTTAPMQWFWKMASKTVAANINDNVMVMGGGNGSDNGTDKGDGAGSAMRRGEAIKGGRGSTIVWSKTVV